MHSCNWCLLTLSASSTSQILTPVAGLKVGNVLPLLDVCHSLLIKICGKWKVFADTYIVISYNSFGFASTDTWFIRSPKFKKKKLQWEWNALTVMVNKNPTLSYLGVSDLLDFDGLGKRHSWEPFGHSILCWSVLCHSRSAVQSTTSLSAPSTKHCQPIHWLFIRMWSSSLLTQQLRRAQLRPYQNIKGPYLRGILFLQHLGNILKHVLYLLILCE